MDNNSTSPSTKEGTMNQLELQFIINACGKNVEINNRQTRSMIGTLASIIQELI